MVAKRIKQDRQAFEDLVYKRYFLSTIKRTGLGGPIEFIAVDCMTQAELCKRDGQDYIRPEISAMWYGWVQALEYERNRK